MKALGKLTKRRILAALVAGAVLLALLPQSSSSWLRGAVQPLLIPLGDGGMYLAVAFRKQLANLGHSKPPADSRVVQDQADYFQGMAVYWMRQSHQHQRQMAMLEDFREAFGPSRDLPAALVEARVVGEDSLPYGATRTVNVGRRRGVGRGQLVVHDRSKAIASLGDKHRMAVVAASTLVGEVTESSSFAARVRLVSDRGFEMAGEIIRRIDPEHPRMVTITTGDSASQRELGPQDEPVQVMAAGDGEGGLIVRDVKSFHNVQPGDLLVTSDKSMMLPVGIRVGTVTAVEDDKKHPGLVHVKVKPELDLSGVRDVLIVVPMGEAGGP